MENDKSKLEKYRNEVWKKSIYYDMVNDFVNDEHHFNNVVSVSITNKADLPIVDQVAKHFDISYELKINSDHYRITFNMLEHYRKDLLLKAQQAFYENYCHYTNLYSNIINCCLIIGLLGLLFVKSVSKFLSAIVYFKTMGVIILVGVIAFICKKYIKYSYQKKIDSIYKEKQ